MVSFRSFAAMVELIVISCFIFQTAIAIYLLHISLLDDDFEKNLQKLMIILLVHLCAKYFLLVFFEQSVFYINLATGFGLLYGPFLFIITRSFIKLPLTQGRKIIHLLPFFSFSVIYILLTIANSLKIITFEFIQRYVVLYQWLVAISQLVYAGNINWLINNYGESSDREPAGGKLLRNISSLLILCALLNILFSLLRFFKTGMAVNFEERFLSYSCFACIPVLILRYKLKTGNEKLKEKSIIMDPVQILAEGIVEMNLAGPDTQVPGSPFLGDEKKMEKKYQKSAVDEFTLIEYQEILTHFIESGKAYLDAELTLEKLASQINIPKHHLTQLLNNKLEKSFYSYINEYRIREATALLKDSSRDINILTLALNCGFNSKSSFNNNFKKITGQTPSEFRKNASIAVILK